MLRTTKLRAKLRRSILHSGVSGEIPAHEAKKNLGSIKLLLKQDGYATFGITEVHNAIRRKQLTSTLAIKIMADSLGITPERYQQAGPGFIEPQATANGLSHMLDAIDEAVAADRLIVLATAHPGSLMAHYIRLAEYIRAKGGRLYETPVPFKVAEYRWLDCVAGVHALTDEGQLLHTHDNSGFWHFLDQLPEVPGLVVADHGYAGAAMNRGVKTAAIHDVDDPGIPMAAYLGLNVIGIPMNDNQLNVPTLAVIEAIIAEHTSA